ncbi:MAG: hypothetical protein U1E53_10825 [Dongiaceae bacterium]
MRAAFARAAAAIPAERRDRRLCLARRPVRLAVAGSALAGAVAATFAHLDDGEAAPEDAAAPAIELWDEQAAGVARPPLTAPALLAWGREEWRMTSHAGHRYLREERPERVAWLDRGHGRLVGSFRAGTALSLQERGRPLARMMGQLYRGFGLVRLHAGLVARGSAGVLLAGASGSGKTACTLDCVAAGFAFLGDDSVGLERDADGRFWGHSLYGSANLLPFHLARAPALAAHALPPGAGEDKALLLPAHVPGCRAARLARIAAILLPRPAEDGATRIAPAAPAQALPLLLPLGADHRQGGLGAAEFARLGALVRAVPCFHLRQGADPAAVAGAIAALLERVAR